MFDTRQEVTCPSAKPRSADTVATGSFQKLVKFYLNFKSAKAVHWAAGCSNSTSGAFWKQSGLIGRGINIMNPKSAVSSPVVWAKLQPPEV